MNANFFYISNIITSTPHMVRSKGRVTSKSTTVTQRSARRSKSRMPSYRLSSRNSTAHKRRSFHTRKPRGTGVYKGDTYRATWDFRQDVEFIIVSQQRTIKAWLFRRIEPKPLGFYYEEITPDLMQNTYTMVEFDALNDLLYCYLSHNRTVHMVRAVSGKVIMKDNATTY